MFYAIRLLDIK